MVLYLASFTKYISIIPLFLASISGFECSKLCDYITILFSLGTINFINNQAFT